MNQPVFIAIDLKSFFASVECVYRGLDPLTTNLVVADASRTDKTICLAVSPSLKSYGIGGRARLFEVVQRVRSVNEQRRWKAPQYKFTHKSSNNIEVSGNPAVELDYIVAPPHMQRYMEVSSRVYATYLKYIAPEDIHVYSIDEVLIDATNYVDRKFKKTSQYPAERPLTGEATPDMQIRDEGEERLSAVANKKLQAAHDLAITMIKDVLKSTGITATAGIGTNLYLAKVAMDIHAKHQKADSNGVRIAELDPISFRRELWNHRPLKDFWRIGKGIASKLEAHGITTMGELARRSLDKGWEAWMFKQFGVAAELIIDHAWGWEPCPMSEIKRYKPQTNSITRGQVLQEPYTFEKARVIVREMSDLIALTLVNKNLKTNQLDLYIGYDIENSASYGGDLVSDWYGRTVPKPAHGSINLERYSFSAQLIIKRCVELYEKIVDPNLSVRRIHISANRLLPAEEAEATIQPTLFDDIHDDPKELRRQQVILQIKKKFGKNAILKGTNFEEGATARERNQQVGGHKE